MFVVIGCSSSMRLRNDGEAPFQLFLVTHTLPSSAETFLLFQNATAIPRTPVPMSNRLEGSGVCSGDGELGNESSSVNCKLNPWIPGVPGPPSPNGNQVSVAE